MKQFTDENFLRLIAQKCEVLAFSHGHASLPACSVDGSILPASGTGKCLGFWWSRDLMATRCIEENKKKARKAFFQYGSIGAFQGDLSPLSVRSVIDTCVIPVLLYGCQNWVVTDSMMDRLESFLGEMAKQALKWPKHYCNTAAVTALGMASIKSRLAVIKLRYLKRVVNAPRVAEAIIRVLLWQRLRGVVYLQRK